MITLKADLTSVTNAGLVKALRGMIFRNSGQDRELQIGDAVLVRDLAGGEELPAIVADATEDIVLLQVDWDAEDHNVFFTPTGSVEQLTGGSLAWIDNRIERGRSSIRIAIPA